MNEADCTIEDLYESLRSKLKGFVTARTRDEALADDIVQDTFVKLTNYCTRGGSCKYPKSFLFRVAANLMADHFRGMVESHVVEVRQQDLEDVPQPGKASLNKEIIECFVVLINQLPEPYREAVRLADIEQMPHKDVAVRMGISLPGVKSRVQRGRAKLRDMLLQMCEIERDRHGNIIQCDPRR
jgi:RNA polymerase sigma-70 factor (ECF subfamily)